MKFPDLVFIVDLEELLAPRRREGHVQLHGELTETEREYEEVTGSLNKDKKWLVLLFKRILHTFAARVKTGKGRWNRHSNISLARRS